MNVAECFHFNKAVLQLKWRCRNGCIFNRNSSLHCRKATLHKLLARPPVYMQNVCRMSPNVRTCGGASPSASRFVLGPMTMSKLSGPPPVVGPWQSEKQTTQTSSLSCTSYHIPHHASYQVLACYGMVPDSLVIATTTAYGTLGGFFDLSSKLCLQETWNSGIARNS